MASDRMGKDEFYTRLAALDEERLKKALWNLSSARQDTACGTP